MCDPERLHLCESDSVCESLSHVQLFATPWTVACQAPLSMGFYRPEYSSGYPFPSPRDLSNPRIKPRSPALQADSLPSHQGSPRILQCIAHPFSSGSPQPINQTGVSCTAGWSLINWATKEAFTVYQFL